MTQHFLDTIVSNTLARNHRLPSLESMLDTLEAKPTVSFSGALATDGLSLIAEVKAASPSKGIIREDFWPLDIAKEFQKKGASALSVLTEPDFFLGKLAYLETISEQLTLPTLRKDFILDKRQIVEAKQAGAAAVLLIVAILEPEQLKELYTFTQEIGLDALIEIHQIDELEVLRALPDVKLIGVNNRDLHSFTTNTQQLFNCLPRIKDMYPDALIVAESGYQHSSDLTRLETEGVDAVLIGEGLAKNQHLIDFFLRDTGIKPTL